MARYVLDEVQKSPNEKLWYGFDLRALGYMEPSVTLASAAWTAPAPPRSIGFSP